MKARPINLKTHEVKGVLEGSEYKPNDIVEIITKTHCMCVKVISYLNDGWYRVQLPNGGYHDTQILGDVVGSANDTPKILQRMKQSSIEWLIEQLAIDKNDPWYSWMIQQAKEMHKQEIVNAWDKRGSTIVPKYFLENNKTGEQYYNETFQNDNP